MESSRKTLTVSVLMGVRNAEPYVDDAIQSVLTQNCSNVEVIIVDDASSDGTLEKVREFATADSRVVVLRNDKQRGLAECLNRAARHARGRFLCRQDGDDVSRRDRIRLQAEFLERHPSVGVVGANYEIINQEGKPISVVELPEEHRDICQELVSRNPMCHTAVMIRAEAFSAVGGYDTRFVFAQDYDLWIRLVGDGWELHNLRAMLVRKRVHETAATIAQRGPQLRYAALARIRGMMEGTLPLRAIWYALASLVKSLAK